MNIHITGAPCCWGVDDVKNPYLPPWQKVLYEAGQAGYKAIELGPYGYLPLNIEEVGSELKKNHISIVAGTIFDDLVDEANYENLLKQVDDICAIITKLPKLPKLPTEPGQRFEAPYLTVMDWGHDERDYAAGHPDKPPRLSEEKWQGMMKHIRGIAEKAKEWGVTHVLFADTFNQTLDCRYIANPPTLNQRGRADITIHQHLAMGEGDVDFTGIFETLREMDFANKQSKADAPKVGGESIACVSMFGFPEKMEKQAPEARERIERELLGK